MTLLLTNTVKSLPVTTTRNTTENETVSVYVPYDVKFVPVEVPDNNTNGLSVSPLQATTNNQSSSSEEYVLVPLSVLSNLSLSEGIPSISSHKISKRQTRRYPFYRPVFRYSRFSTGRRRVGGSTFGNAVGYLNDRDYFPTVA